MSASDLADAPVGDVGGQGLDGSSNRRGRLSAADYPGLLSAKDNAMCAPLLIQRNPELCLECHNPKYYDEEKGNNHPMRPYHFDVAAQAPLTCTSMCHNPHGSNKNYMLLNYAYPFDGQCLQCHGKVGYPRVGIDF